jgi:hypothetical protein
LYFKNIEAVDIKAEIPSILRGYTCIAFSAGLETASSYQRRTKKMQVSSIESEIPLLSAGDP